MNQVSKMFNASIGRKVIMALTGLFLCVFLVEHLYGNLLMYKNDGGVAFNQYTEDMTHNLLIRTVEVVLFLGFIFHIADGIMLSLRNRTARPVKYAVSKASETSSWFSRNMLLTGSIIFIFLVIHLRSFFIEYRFLDPGVTMFESVRNAFQTGWYATLYFIAMIVLGAHLNHGFQSAFQTLGLSNRNYTPIFKSIGTGFAIIIAVGFASFPIVFYFKLI